MPDKQQIKQKIMKNTRKKSFEKSFFEALKDYGYTLPETDAEVEQYLATMGSTKLEISDRLSDTETIYYEVMSEKETGDIESIAAHEQNSSSDLPSDFLESLDEKGDVINNHEKRKRKN